MLVDRNFGLSQSTEALKTKKKIAGRPVKITYRQYTRYRYRYLDYIATIYSASYLGQLALTTLYQGLYETDNP